LSYALLDTPIEFLKGVGPRRAEVLQKELGIFKFVDLLFYFPFRYVDRTKFYRINEINPDMQYVQLKGKIVTIETIQGKGRNQRLSATFSDGQGVMELIWFTGIRWIKSSLKVGAEYVIFGRPSSFNGKLNMAHPELELLIDHLASPQGKLQAVYSTTEKAKNLGLDSKGISKLAITLLGQIPPNSFQESLSSSILSELQLISREQALRKVHMPPDNESMQKALFRLKFEELFYSQLRLLQVKNIRKQQLRGIIFEKIDTYFDQFYHQYLPFELTNAQKRVLKEIRKDTLGGFQMNRLLQGDVGSGKTIVALMTMLMGIDNGYQATLLAPTEILANQHFKTISHLLRETNLNVGLLTGSTKKSERKELFANLEQGNLHILIGTHAIIEDPVIFKNLGIAVIDEQHRFGVAQRAKLWGKNKNNPPHVLVMTATPIPRTLAMTLYGDLDVSIIDELPPGRKPIKTQHFYDFSRQKVMDLMAAEINKGRQCYVVYPLIEESEKIDMKNLMDGFEQIQAALPQFSISMLHGRMTAEAKENEMKRFAAGLTNIMVSTTVIEVGVDVPNASIMLIENAERFGLSQLHQLRGRVGRGADQSYCLLVTHSKLSNDAQIRMQTMVRTNNGFEISEVDLDLRGPGDIEGTRQSGDLKFKIADLAHDQQILAIARDVAQRILEDDPELIQPNNLVIRKILSIEMQTRNAWARIS
jgi:ATP-dependent DNA helicase RecG